VKRSYKQTRIVDPLGAQNIGNRKKMTPLLTGGNMLANMINQHALADAQAGKWDAVAAALNALRSDIVDQTHWSFGLMMSQGQLPQELVVGIATAVKTAASVNPLMESAFIAFSTTGLQLHTSDRQAMIESIGAGLPSEAVAAVKSLGVRSAPVITTTADDCRKAWTISETRRTVSVLSAKATAVNAWCDALDLTTKTPAEVQAYCDSLLTSTDGNPG
jgi:hypothetical protein